MKINLLNTTLSGKGLEGCSGKFRTFLQRTPPGISGIELCYSIRAWEKASDKKPVPIVGLTAHALSDTTNPCLQSGMNKVLQKPIQPDTLQMIIDNFVAKPSQTGDEQQPTIKPETGLGIDLPNTDAQLFELDSFPLLDIEAGKKTMGDEQVLKDLLKMMVEDEIPKESAALKKAYLEKNWELIEYLAHKIKGGAAYCGTIKMQYACQYLERYRKAGHSQQLDKLYHQLIEIVEQTKISITFFLQNK